MGNSVSNVGFTDYAAEQANIDRRKKMAEALMAQGASPIDMPQTAPGGFTPHVSWTQGLAKMLQAYTGAKGVQQAEEKQKELSSQYQAAASGDIQSLVKALGGRQAQTVQPDPQEAQQSADQGTPQVGPVNIPAQTPQESLTDALPNMRTPMGQQMATAYLTSNLKNDEKFGHTPVTMKGPDGKLVQVLVGDKGTVRPVNGFQTAEKLHFADTGNGIQPVSEYTGQPQGAPIAKGMTPDAEANLGFRKFEFANLSKNQQGQLGTELARLGISQQQLQEGRVQLVTDADGQIHLVNKMTGIGTNAVSPTGDPLKVAKPLTETQGKANLFGSRADEADKILQGLETKISTTGLATKRGLENLPVIGGVLGSAGNTMLSGNQQKVEQAQRNFVNAVLRVESGAAISESEFRNATKQYFPQPGDTSAVIDQKRQNRATAINGLKAMGSRSGVAPNQAQPSLQADASTRTVNWNDLGR